MEIYYWVLTGVFALSVYRRLYILCNPDETPEKPDQGVTGIALCIMIALMVWTLTEGGLL